MADSVPRDCVTLAFWRQNGHRTAYPNLGDAGMQRVAAWRFFELQRTRQFAAPSPALRSGAHWQNSEIRILPSGELGRRNFLAAERRWPHSRLPRSAGDLGDRLSEQERVVTPHLVQRDLEGR